MLRAYQNHGGTMKIKAIATAGIAACSLTLGLSACGGNSINWYAKGESFATQNDNYFQYDLLSGAAGPARAWCGGMSITPPASWVTRQLPPDGENTEFLQWLKGCLAGYNQTPPGTDVAIPAYVPPSSTPSAGSQAAAPAVPTTIAPSPLRVSALLAYDIPQSECVYIDPDPGDSTYGWTTSGGTPDIRDGAFAAVPVISPALAQFNQPGNEDEPGAGVFTGWIQGAQVTITDSGILPAEPAAGYPVTLTFQNAAGTTVYTMTVPVQVSVSSFQDTMTSDFSAGTSATGASSVTATTP